MNKNYFMLLNLIFLNSTSLIASNHLDDCLEEIGVEHPQSVVSCIKERCGDCQDGLVHIRGPELIKEKACCD